MEAIKKIEVNKVIKVILIALLGTLFLTISAKIRLESDLGINENTSEEISEHLWFILSTFNKAGDILIKGDDNCLLLLLENSSQEYAETIVSRITKIMYIWVR